MVIDQWTASLAVLRGHDNTNGNFHVLSAEYIQRIVCWRPSDCFRHCDSDGSALSRAEALDAFSVPRENRVHFGLIRCCRCCCRRLHTHTYNVRLQWSSCWVFKWHLFRPDFLPKLAVFVGHLLPYHLQTIRTPMRASPVKHRTSSNHLGKHRIALSTHHFMIPHGQRLQRAGERARASEHTHTHTHTHTGRTLSRVPAHTEQRRHAGCQSRPKTLMDGPVMGSKQRRHCRHAHTYTRTRSQCKRFV